MFYSDKLRSFSGWATKKCSMNGTPDKYIRTMLSQMLKELGLNATASYNLTKVIYSRDFDASPLVNKIYKNKEDIFDIMNKDGNIRISSIQAVNTTIRELNINISGYDKNMQASLCVFIQFILSGGRSELEGFGVSSDLIEKWKKESTLKKKKENDLKQKLIHEQMKNQQTITVDEEEKEEETILPLTEEIAESWEDL
tara:strand:+ start:16503 stop:17096 length:594 start_codon:yes stop_codon:yes gene_type:complete